MAVKVVQNNSNPKNDSSKEFRIKQLEDGITRAEQNIQIFTDEVQKQIVLKNQLEAELSILKSSS